MATDGSQIIAAPQAAPPRLGLLASSARPPVIPDHWQNGIRFRPERGVGRAALNGGAFWLDCAYPSAIPDKATPRIAVPDVVEWMPWTIVEDDDDCPADGFLSTDYQGRARRILQANESRMIERELWTGEIAAAAGFANPVFADPGTPDLGTFGPEDALAVLQQYIADHLTGRGMIHARPRVVSVWDRNNQLNRQGNVLYDAFDNVIVPGTGYPGTSPAGTAPDTAGEWAYCSPIVYVLEDDIVVTPDTFEQAFDRSRNRIVYLAERTVLAYHDDQAVAAVRVEPAGSDLLLALAGGDFLTAS